METFAPIEIETESAIPVAELEANIRLNASRGIPFLLNEKFPERNDRLAIVAGGSSLRETIHELRDFKYIMVVGTAHDHLIEQGFNPDYSVFCDSGPDLHAFRRKLQKNCIYLMATQCDETLVTHLADCDVRLWDMEGWVNPDVFDGRPRIAGGSTAALRAPSLAYVLGFRDLHMFGLDSSFADTHKRHAYQYDDVSEIQPGLTCRINGRRFQTSMQMLAQAKDFQKILEGYSHLFSITVHGDSLIGDIWKDFRAKHDRVFNREKAA